MPAHNQADMVTKVLPRSTVSRAELLRAVCLEMPDKRVTHRLAELAGYQATLPIEQITTAIIAKSEPAMPAPVQNRDETLPQEQPELAPKHGGARARFWAVTERVKIAPVATMDVGKGNNQPLYRADLLGHDDTPDLEWQSILPKARFMAALKRNLRTTRLVGLDVSQLVHFIAQAKPLRRLPRSPRKGWTENMLLILDLSEPLLPYHMDMHQLACDLRRWIGRANVDVRIVLNERHPFGTWQAWHGDLQNVPPTHFGEGWNGRWGRIMLVSELGLYANDGQQTIQAWTHFLQNMQHNNSQLQVWCPLPLGNAEAVGLARIPVVHWSRGSILYPRPLAGAREHRTPVRLTLAQQLRTRLAIVTRIDPGILRAMRLTMGPQAQDVGLEHLAWSHPDMTRHATVRTIKANRLADYRRAFMHLSDNEKYSVLDVILQQHLPHRPLLAYIEILAWAAHATESQRKMRQDIIDRALDVINRISKDQVADGVAPKNSLIDFMERFLQDADQQTRALCSPAMGRMMATVQKEKYGDRPITTTLTGVAIVDVEQALGLTQPAIPYWLSMDCLHGWLMLTHEKPKPWHCLIDNEIKLSAVSIQIDGQPPLWQNADANRNIAIARLPWGETDRIVSDYWHYFFSPFVPPDIQDKLHLTTGNERLTIEEIERPEWALEWARDSQGLYALAPTPLGTGLRIPYPRISQLPRQKLSSSLTLDLDEIGLIATLTIADKYTQSFRYIIPGQFIMGASAAETENETSRVPHLRERPQHGVKISTGFWLAESTCTQAIWRAAMGQNPSYFNDANHGGPEYPVESVSWNEVQKFLRKLAELLPDCRVTLPTEAEWEYACRADTRTTFSMGATASMQEANYDDYNLNGSGTKGNARMHTIPTKDLAPNPWGLYQMHGNLFEWCADTPRQYGKEPITDPGLNQARSPSQSKTRALRGGSWASPALAGRSAARAEAQADHWDGKTGFRIVLRPRKQIDSLDDNG